MQGHTFRRESRSGLGARTGPDATVEFHHLVEFYPGIHGISLAGIPDTCGANAQLTRARLLRHAALVGSFVPVALVFHSVPATTEFRAREDVALWRNYAPLAIVRLQEPETRREANCPAKGGERGARGRKRLGQGEPRARRRKTTYKLRELGYPARQSILGWTRKREKIIEERQCPVTQLMHRIDFDLEINAERSIELVLVLIKYINSFQACKHLFVIVIR